MADLDLEDLTGPSPATNQTLRQALIVCGVVLIVTVPILIWAIFFRTRAKQRHSHHRHAQVRMDSPAAPAGGTSVQQGALAGAKPTAIAGTSAENSLAPSRRHRKRHRRRAHRPLNPTLAETGGLPPVKTNPSSESST